MLWGWSHGKGDGFAQMCPPAALPTPFTGLQQDTDLGIIIPILQKRKQRFIKVGVPQVTKVVSKRGLRSKPGRQGSVKECTGLTVVGLSWGTFTEDYGGLGVCVPAGGPGACARAEDWDPRLPGSLVGSASPSVRPGLRLQ